MYNTHTYVCIIHTFKYMHMCMRTHVCIHDADRHTHVHCVQHFTHIPLAKPLVGSMVRFCVYVDAMCVNRHACMYMMSNKLCGTCTMCTRLCRNSCKLGLHTCTCTQNSQTFSYLNRSHAHTHAHNRSFGHIYTHTYIHTIHMHTYIHIHMHTCTGARSMPSVHDGDVKGEIEAAFNVSSHASYVYV